MDCKDIKILMIEELYNEISPENKILLDKHLNKCKDCSAEFTELLKTNQTLKLWQNEKTDRIELPHHLSERKKPKRILYRIAAVAAAILIVFSLINFHLAINENGLDIKFSLLGNLGNSENVAANILENGSQIEQLQLMTELINTANDRQKQDMVVLLTDFYQAIEMRRQADLKVITQNMETLQSFSNQRMEETEQNMQNLIQYTGSILDKSNYIKTIDKP